MLDIAAGPVREEGGLWRESPEWYPLLRIVFYLELFWAIFPFNPV
jgi:hypothetical protein